MTHQHYMQQAIKLASKAAQRQEVPIAALLVVDQRIIAKAYNRRESLQDATAHAEILAIRQACKKNQDWRLDQAILYVTMEPCLMCFGAATQARIRTIVYGCKNPKNPPLLRQIYQQWPQAPKLIGEVEADSATALLSRFFKNLR